jgi:hypothetical protein
MNDSTDDRATQLRERLDRLAGDVPADGGVDGAQLYRQSLRRRRRRGVATTALVAGATAAVIVGGATWLPGANDDGAPRPSTVQPPVAAPGGDDGADARAEVIAGIDDPGGRTAGQTVEVTRAEAERRCTTVWHNYWGPSDVTVQLRADSGPWFEGDAVKIANAKAFDYSPFDVSSTDGRCVIPQAGLETGVGTVALPLPAAEDVAGIRTSCGQYLGWDFSDWQLVVADRAESRLAALLRSPDGYIARCELDSTYLDASGAVDNDAFVADPRAGFAPFVEITTPEKFQDEADAFGDYRVMPSLLLRCHEKGAGQDEEVCLGAGLVSGPEPIARIVVTDETGVEQEVPVVDGWVAFAGTVTKQAAGELHVAVHAADGSVLAEYDAGD